MLFIIIIIIVFIITITLVELNSLFMYGTDKPRQVENLYVDNSDDEDNISLLKKITGNDFIEKIYNASETIPIENKNLIFFNDYDIFLNNNIKLNKNIIYNIPNSVNIDIINYKGEKITIYVN
jgi:hypothetical protein